MKKNYLIPTIMVQTVALQNMIAASEWEEEPVIPVDPSPAVVDGDVKDFFDVSFFE